MLNNTESRANFEHQLCMTKNMLINQAVIAIGVNRDYPYRRGSETKNIMPERERVA